VMVPANAVSNDDLRLLRLTDSPDEVVAMVQESRRRPIEPNGDTDYRG